LSIPFSPLLHEIFLELIVCSIGQIIWYEARKQATLCEVLLTLAWAPHQFILGVVYIFVTIGLYDHVMHDHICVHHIPRALLVPKPRRSSHNSMEMFSSSSKSNSSSDKSYNELYKFVVGQIKKLNELFLMYGLQIKWAKHGHIPCSHFGEHLHCAKLPLG
jgi:hypothetical protein